MIPDILKTGSFLQLLTASMTMMVVGGFALTLLFDPFAIATPSEAINTDGPLERVGWMFGLFFLMALPAQLAFAVVGSFVWTFARRFVSLIKRR